MQDRWKIIEEDVNQLTFTSALTSPTELLLVKQTVILSQYYKHLNELKLHNKEPAANHESKIIWFVVLCINVNVYSTGSKTLKNYEKKIVQ